VLACINNHVLKAVNVCLYTMLSNQGCDENFQKFQHHRNYEFEGPIYISTSTTEMRWVCTPSILEPNFDLLWFNVSKNGAVLDKLLPTDRTRLWAFVIHSL
jgi:hypothetical protein